MKYTLSANQIAAKHIGILDKVDIVDLCLFDAFKSFANSKRCEKRIDEGGIWFWISYAEIIEDAPLLGIKTKDGIYRRMLKLRDAGIIVFHPDNQKLAKTFFQWGENYDAMERKDWPECTTDEKPKVGNLRMKNRMGTDEKPKGYGQKTEPPTDEKPNNQYTNNQDTNQTTTPSEIADAGVIDFIVKSTTKDEGVTMAEMVSVKAEKEKDTPSSAAPLEKEKELSARPAPGESAPRRWDAFDIDKEASVMKADYRVCEKFASDLRMSLEDAKVKLPLSIDEFVSDQKAVTYNYQNPMQMRRHYFNWILTAPAAKAAAKIRPAAHQHTPSPVPQNIRRL